ncbi:ParB N-terminal domain-containing protein [Chromobacterium subtsugae]|uniref:ParB N-terminal domain-containing protein n=1 Tax=Chromobacterium subtsugae TaxID=251747 RepID=A0ABS7FAU6_9NEIS|nr:MULTISPECIES: ParB N-terminal domain-containing protein [Chromobacterium]KUM03434.1 hypothetical protein Cv017_19815 [Chromobacterium subtsugae]KZE86077.1 hypothetical protein AWB61_17505 [Chromobacterium sp. F49]MBW7564903.1 ParB N-terminal domain-containing protein [Chromobacterium subtsugae]MBW8286570.1 ParB N-terminal domain-containing protein [Chromobacterium subtsugae]WSE91388.1 ParB N-terminal domain-containing protein [Chromobacterium subtsugae]
MNPRPIETAAAKPKLALLPPDRLKPTEEFLPERLGEVAARVLADGGWKTPILVERRTLVVMDGHHRREFALRHGLMLVPCLLLDYADVALEARRDDLLVTPEEVIARGLEGRPYPPKSTRHTPAAALDCSCWFALDELLPPRA